jgi:hypothetical protein
LNLFHSGPWAWKRWTSKYHEVSQSYHHTKFSIIDPLLMTLTVRQQSLVPPIKIKLSLLLLGEHNLYELSAFHLVTTTDGMQSGKKEVYQLLRLYRSLRNRTSSMSLHNLQETKMLFHHECTTSKLATITTNMLHDQTARRVASTLRAIPQSPVASTPLTTLR